MFISCILILTGMQPKICTDQAGPGKLPFTKNTGISLDRQESTGGKTAWLAPFGSPQEVNSCL